jgi:hypothetical protein
MSGPAARPHADIDGLGDILVAPREDPLEVGAADVPSPEDGVSGDKLVRLVFARPIRLFFGAHEAPPVLERAS